MKRIIRTLHVLVAAAAVLFAASGEAHANCSSGTSCSGPLDKIYVDASATYALIDPAGDTAGLSGLCADDSDQFLRLDLGTNSGRAVYQLLMASYLAGQPVKVRAKSVSGVCWVAYVSNPM